MKLILDVSDNTKAIVITAMVDRVSYLSMTTLTIDTDGIKDGETYGIPEKPEKKEEA